MSNHDVIAKLMDEITEFLESSPQSAELVERIRALTPEPRGDATVMSQEDKKSIPMTWTPEQPILHHAQYQSNNAPPPDSGSSFLFTNAFPGLHNPMGQHQDVEMYTQNSFQPFVHIPGASLPRGPTLSSAALPTDAQHFNVTLISLQC